MKISTENLLFLLDEMSINGIAKVVETLLNFDSDVDTKISDSHGEERNYLLKLIYNYVMKNYKINIYNWIAEEELEYYE